MHRCLCKTQLFHFVELTVATEYDSTTVRYSTEVSPDHQYKDYVDDLKMSWIGLLALAAFHEAFGVIVLDAKVHEKSLDWFRIDSPVLIVTVWDKLPQVCLFCIFSVVSRPGASRV